MRKLFAVALLFVCSSALAADPPRPYHLQLEANATAPFPWLSKFGKVQLDVYRGGVRADSIWLDALSRNGAAEVTVLNPLGRQYVEVPVADITPIITRLAEAGGIEKRAKPEIGPKLNGKVAGIPAVRHRLVYGKNAWIDYWTTDRIPENPQLRDVVHRLVDGISPGTAQVARTISGTPLYVELNFRRFQKLPILYVKKFVWEAEDEEDALTRGSFYMRNSVLEMLWKD